MSNARSRLRKFEDNFKDVDLASYFELQKNPFEHIEIHTEVQENRVQLHIHYKKFAPPLKLSLPPELIRLIGEYLSYSILVHAKIEYSSNYPFVPPIWFIEEVKHNIVRQEYGPFYLLNYYIGKLKDHNHQYNRYIMDQWNDLGNGLIDNSLWSPAITVEKDILVFLQRINHFGEMTV